MRTDIAIIGMACRYPNARSPLELWENVLARRRAFRRMPPERLRLEDYLSANGDCPDCTYSTEAALIEGYEFDRVRFRIGGSTFRSADLVHWLALDISSQALEDAGFPDGDGLPHDVTGVFLGNTLTGEFSRANLMRLRWPYVRRTVEAMLLEEGWESVQRRAFLKELETRYKDPFPSIGEETLAGGLSNTIAGRICNYFDMGGGGYTVDGACASSLLAVANACSALVTGELDVALAGGVDLSLDPFEIVGFAKVGALASEEMRVYDARSAGFWPGEGCGFVTLMRHEDAVAQGHRIYAAIHGWGISSDGNGGITRPEVKGQLLALRRAYRRAGFGIETVAYFEGHGTGTTVGDATELRALSHARREALPDAPPAAISSIKANIGHTKAASGVAGLIKATMALHNSLIPPATGCETPHPEVTGDAPMLRILDEGEIWPTDRPLRAGVSAMGFGGINAHIVLEGAAIKRRKTLSEREHDLLSSSQDAELFLLSAQDVAGLRQQVEHLLTFAARLSRAELTDLAAHLAATLDDHQVRAAVVASSPANLASRLDILWSWLGDGVAAKLDPRNGVFLDTVKERSRDAAYAEPRIGFLFPGQGSLIHLGGALQRRFEFVKELYAWADLPTNSDSIDTAVAQPAIIAASLAGLRTLDHFGIRASVAVGHSLGELTALHWGGALDEEALLRIATIRGKIMSELGNPTGTMASIAAGQAEVEKLLSDFACSNHDKSGGYVAEGSEKCVVIAGLNSSCQTVISGKASAVAAIVAGASGMKSVNLPVSHAFHSPLVAAAAPALAAELSSEEFLPLQRNVVSTVTGILLTQDADLRQLLYQQVTAPVRFQEAVESATVEGIDLLIEVGPGRVLSGLVTDFVETPVMALDACASSLKGLLNVVGATFALGASVNHKALFDRRFARPFNLDWQPRFFVNPCELAPIPEDQCSAEDAEYVSNSAEPTLDESPVSASSENLISQADVSPVDQINILDLVLRLVAEQVELPISAVREDDHLLGDLHMNSISVGQLVAKAARRLNLPPPVAPTDYADATVAEIARALEAIQGAGGAASVYLEERVASGVDTWIRAFTVEFTECPLPPYQASKGLADQAVITPKGGWQVIAPSDHPLAIPLQQALDDSGGGGVVVCLPPKPDERHVKLLLEGAQAVLAGKDRTRFVLVQHGGGSAAFARTLHLEAPESTTCVVDVPLDHPKSVEWVIAEAMAAVGHTEAYYDASGRRREPVLQLLPMLESKPNLNLEEPTDLPLSSEDVLLVTGGGKGITAECAFSLAQETGARLALIGRSHPDASAELAANLDRMTAAGIEFCYISADVTDENAVRSAVHEVESTLGTVTAVLHGAGANVPQSLRTLDETAFLKTLAPKVQGTRNLLAAIDPDHLHLFISFGSVIARVGMRGEADYAVANEWLSNLVEEFAAEHPDCQCLVVEWSIWSGVGMGERLGRVDALMQQGITPITPDDGIRILRNLLTQYKCSASLPVSVVVTGRFGETPTLKMELPELPFMRFLEQPRVFYPGVELVVDSELSRDADPYLEDHVFQGERLLPGVMGLEALAQVAMALVGTSKPPIFEDVQFARPVIVPENDHIKIRVAALAREANRVEVVLRSSETAFQIDHFRAICQFNSTAISNVRPQIQKPEDELPCVQIDPERDLYGAILFQSGRFQRLRGYRRLMATGCLAEIAPDTEINWFGYYLPAKLALGDPGARDAAIHGIQPCIPHATLLPIGVERLIPGATQTPGARFMYAQERVQEGDILTYDVSITSADGHLLEQWEGLRLKVITGMAAQGPWVEPLLGPYVERRVRELIPSSSVAVVVERDSSVERRLRSDRAIQRALGAVIPIRRRPDGKPEIGVDGDVSAAHANDLTLAIAGSGTVGCDVEPVVARPDSVWQDLLGKERFMLAEVIAQEAGEDQDTAATRAWTAGECLKKAGVTVNIPLIFVSSNADGWVLLSAGEFAIATFVASIRGIKESLVLAVLTENNAQFHNQESSGYDTLSTQTRYELVRNDNADL